MLFVYLEGPGHSPKATRQPALQDLKHTREGVSGLGFWVSGLGFRVSGLGFRVKGLGFRV